MSEKNDILVQVDHLKKYFPVKGVHGPGVQAVEDVSLFIRRGECRMPAEWRILLPKLPR